MRAPLHTLSHGQVEPPPQKGCAGGFIVPPSLMGRFIEASRGTGGMQVADLWLGVGAGAEVGAQTCRGVRWPTPEGKGGTMALPVGLQGAPVLSLPLNPPLSLGGQDPHPHFTGGETEVLGAQESLRPWPPAPPRAPLTLSLARGGGRRGRALAAGSSLLLSGTLCSRRRLEVNIRACLD